MRVLLATPSISRDFINEKVVDKMYYIVFRYSVLCRKEQYVIIISMVLSTLNKCFLNTILYHDIEDN